MPIKTAVIGAGSVGSRIGARLIKAGHPVKYGVRDVSSDKTKALLEAQKGAEAAAVQDAVSWADVIVLATPGSNNAEGIIAGGAALGPGVANKVIIDATNPLTSYPGLEVRWGSDGTSGGEVLSNSLPNSKVYKAFNTIGAENMDKADDFLASGVALTMLVAGPTDDSAVNEIIKAVGFEPKYVGPIRYARNLEAIAELWIHLSAPPIGFNNGLVWGRDFHFQVVKKDK